MSEKCWICGKDIVESFGAMDIMSGRFCKEHWREHQNQYKQIVADYLKLKTQIMFERSVRLLENTGMNITAAHLGF